MSSAKWRRHSTFLSVRWRTWIGRALMASAFLANVGGGLAGLWQWVKRGYQHRPTGGGTPRKEGGLFSPRYGAARSATRQRGQLNGAVRDGC
jgi:hypothetical protein